MSRDLWAGREFYLWLDFRSSDAGRDAGATFMSRIRTVLEMIKIEHSVFALPFALVGALLAARSAGTWPSWSQFAWIVVAMVGARSAAMTMNRIADIEY